MFSLAGFPPPARTLGIFLASLFGGVLLPAATIGTSAGTVLSGSYSLDQNINSGYIVYQGTSGGNSASGVLSTGDLDSTSGSPVAYSYTLPIDLGTGPVAFLGLDTSGGVALTANNGVAPSYVGAPWPYAEAETQIETDILAGDSSALVSFLTAHSGDFFYAPGTTQATFLAFTSGQPIGAMSLTATAVPEPLGWALTAIGLGAVAIRRRRACCEKNL